MLTFVNETENDTDWETIGDGDVISSNLKRNLNYELKNMLKFTCFVVASQSVLLMNIIVRSIKVRSNITLNLLFVCLY